MRLVRWGTEKTSAEVMSGILNCVCPECGGSMGGVSREFKCQGQCQTDWRQIWEQIFSGGVNQRIENAIRPNWVQRTQPRRPVSRNQMTAVNSKQASAISETL